MPTAKTINNYNDISPPGATTTGVAAMNAMGEVVGTYYITIDQYYTYLYDAGAYTTINGVAIALNLGGEVLGLGYDGVPFVYDQGAYTPIAYPGAELTSVADINNAGVVVGNYLSSPSAPGPDGFYYRNGAYHTVDMPGATATIPLAVSNNGNVTGYFSSAAGPQGFVDHGGVFTSIAIAGAGLTEGVAVNEVGQVAGNYYIYNGPNVTASGFVLDGAAVTPIQVPGAFATAVGGKDAINNSGVVTGSFSNATGTHGFIYAGGSYTTLDVAGATYTEIVAIADRPGPNGKYLVSGDYTDGSGTRHGFEARVALAPVTGGNVVLSDLVPGDPHATADLMPGFGQPSSGAGGVPANDSGAAFGAIAFLQGAPAQPVPMIADRG